MGARFGRTISLVDPDRFEDDDNTIISESVTRTLSTSAGTYLSSPLYGYDITEAIGEGIDVVSGRRIGARAASAIEDDERVRAARLPVESLLQSVATFDVQIDAFEEGPFELTGALSDPVLRERLRQRDEVDSA